MVFRPARPAMGSFSAIRSSSWWEAVTAAGAGCQAAIDAEKSLQEQGEGEGKRETGAVAASAQLQRAASWTPFRGAGRITRFFEQLNLSEIELSRGAFIASVLRDGVILISNIE